MNGMFVDDVFAELIRVCSFVAEVALSTSNREDGGVHSEADDGQPAEGCAR